MVTDMIMYKMSYILLISFLIVLPGTVLGCKSKPVKPSCPEGYWKVPDGWKCHGHILDPLIDMIRCANDYKCMNSAFLCDGRRSIRREDTYSHDYGWNNSDANYPNGSPDENMCTDEFCSTLTDGRTRRCPGTTRCISPTVNYPGIDIPIGPICKEVKTFLLTYLSSYCWAIKKIALSVILFFFSGAFSPVPTNYDTF